MSALAVNPIGSALKLTAECGTDCVCVTECDCVVAVIDCDCEDTIHVLAEATDGW